MSGLLGVQRVHVPRTAVSQVVAHLRAVGHRGNEGLGFWVGEIDAKNPRVFHVREALIPQQKAIRSREGVAVVVEADELHRIGVWLYEKGYQIMAQLHSHPGDAYHSDTDDDFSIATTAGSLSLVVADFARYPFALKHCAVFRLNARGIWAQLFHEDVETLIIIE